MRHQTLNIAPQAVYDQLNSVFHSNNEVQQQAIIDNVFTQCVAEPAYYYVLAFWAGINASQEIVQRILQNSDGDLPRIKINKLISCEIGLLLSDTTGDVVNAINDTVRDKIIEVNQGVNINNEVEVSGLSFYTKLAKVYDQMSENLETVFNHLSLTILSENVKQDLRDRIADLKRNADQSADAHETAQNNRNRNVRVFGAGIHTLFSNTAEGGVSQNNATNVNNFINRL